MNKPLLKLESYRGTPMLVLYYGQNHQFNLRLTKKKIMLFEDYQPILKQFVAAIDADKLGEFAKDLEALGYSQEPVRPVAAAPEDGAIKKESPTKMIESKETVTFK